MSGLTGFITNNGIDLSYVFSPLWNSASLNNENVFNAKNTFLAGIAGPSAGITYTSDMIGYTVTRTGTLADFSMTSGAIYSVQASSTNALTLGAGVWMVTAYSTLQPSNNAGSCQFSTTGLSTNQTSYVGGTGARSVCGSMSIPANTASRIIGSFTTTIVVPTGGASYWQLINVTFSTFTVQCLATNCFITATRVA